MFHALKEFIKSICPDFILNTYHTIMNYRECFAVNHFNRKWVELQRGGGGIRTNRD